MTANTTTAGRPATAKPARKTAAKTAAGTAAKTAKTTATTATKTTAKKASKPASKPATRTATGAAAKASMPAARAASRPSRKGAHAPDPAQQGQDPARLIDARIHELGDWRGQVLARIRKLIHQADPHVVETWKWRGVPVWEHEGILCTCETYRNHVKLTFARGAALHDPAGLFNASLEGNARRAIDIGEHDALDEAAFKALIGEAVALNVARRTRAPRAR